MPRYVFYSFHYDNDCHRTQMVRNIGALSGNRIANPNEWHEVTKKGPGAIRSWIEGELYGKSCAIVMIGSQTSSRPWCLYEIKRAWDLGKGILGIHVHNLKDLSGRQSYKGANPCIQEDALGIIGHLVPVHDPVGIDSSGVYRTIAGSIESWIEQAIAVRNKYL